MGQIELSPFLRWEHRVHKIFRVQGPSGAGGQSDAEPRTPGPHSECLPASLVSSLSLAQPIDGSRAASTPPSLMQMPRWVGQTECAFPCCLSLPGLSGTLPRLWASLHVGEPFCSGFQAWPKPFASYSLVVRILCEVDVKRSLRDRIIELGA